MLIKNPSNYLQNAIVKMLMNNKYAPIRWTRFYKIAPDLLQESEQIAPEMLQELVKIAPEMLHVEVKAGATGTLRSLLLLMDELPHPIAVRLYAGALKIDTIHTPTGKKIHLLNLPYFLAGKIKEYVEWMKGQVGKS